MNTDEQRVRTMCGWIGVEISKSRKRRVDDPETGLYRVRGSLPVQWSIRRGESEIDRSPGQSEPTLWTGYLFQLEDIQTAVHVAIFGGTPDGPQDLVLHHPNPKQAGGDKPAMVIPTRWTSAYGGRRDLGVAEPRVGAPSGETARQRQRRGNAEFQAEHLELRSYGLRRRHAEKERRMRDTQ